MTKIPNFNRSQLTFAFALVSTIGLTIVVLILSYISSPLLVYIQSVPIWVLAVLFIFMYLIIHITFSLALKAQMQSSVNTVYNLLPDTPSLDNQAPVNEEELSEEIVNISLNKSQEINTLYEREDYRREFLGNVSHELKTPLFSIQGYLLTLIEGGVEDNSIRDKYLNRINKSVERLTYIVKDLDLITALESGNMKLDMHPFNIVALTQEVFDLLEIKAENNDVILQFEKPYNTPIKVLGDIERIEQVMTNLIANAINHSQKSSTVSVSFQSEGNKIKISVKDTGMGIKPEFINRIFERFYRIDHSRSRNHGGSGLGLSIVKHILDGHNEKIAVESEYGQGATFYFYLQKV